MYGHGESLEEILAADVISFDVFDTLLWRNVGKPTDAFRIVQEYVNDKTTVQLTADFPLDRVEAEREAYQRYGLEATFDQIYETFSDLYGYTGEYLEIIKQAELYVENTLLRANPVALSMYRTALREEKKVYVVSDMYLPKAFIREALRRNGIKKWAKLIVSSHDKLAKHDGTAFALMVRENPGARIIHVGDNDQSDIRQAAAFGIKTVYTEKALDLISYESSDHIAQTARGSKLHEFVREGRNSLDDTRQSIVAALVAQRIVCESFSADAEIIGYSTAGPMLLGYVQWLHATAQANGTKELFFLARDGAIMQKAYNDYYGDNAIANKYIYASRRLYNFANIQGRLKQRDLDFLTASDADMKIGQFLDRFDITWTNPDVETALRSLELTTDSVIAKNDNSKLRALFVLIEPLVLESAATSRKVVKGYLSENGLMRPNVAVVDIGWHGTMQESIMELTGNKTTIGLYFGINNSPATRNNQTMLAYLDERKQEDLFSYSQYIKRSIEVIEYLFSNPSQRSIVGLSKKGKQYQPAFSRSSDLEEGERQCLRSIQAAARRFVKDYRDATQGFSTSIINVGREISLRALGYMLGEPSSQQASLLGAIKHEFAQGVASRPIGMPLRGRSYYANHPLALRQEYDITYWKPGFVKNASAMGLSDLLGEY